MNRRNQNGRNRMYLDNCPEWDFIKDFKIGRISILRNGNISIAVNMGAYNLNMRNTCAFDFNISCRDQRNFG